MSVVIDGSSGITTNSGTVVSTTDATLNGLTVGKGGGSASNNTAVGASAIGSSNTGNYNTALGYQTLTANTSGSYNTAIGNGCLTSVTTGGNNTGVGNSAGGKITTGADNIAIGVASLGYNAASTTGSYNVAVGDFALTVVSSGNSNTAVGYNAGTAVTTGGNNVLIGSNAGVAANPVTTGSNNILIGGSASLGSTGDGNTIVISGNSVNGKGGSTGYINPNGGGVYQGNNSSSWSTTSDQRLKKNIVDNTDGLNKITAVRVRNFEYRLPEEVEELDQACAVPNTGVQLGVIAQELKAVVPECVKEESTGVLSVDPDNLTWYMVNAIQELKVLVDAQATEIAELKAKVG